MIHFIIIGSIITFGELCSIRREFVHKYYTILEEIGNGASATVHKCREKKTGKFFAAKILGTLEKTTTDFIRQEVDIMTQLNHPNLLTLYDAFEDENQTALIVELLHGKNLYTLRTDYYYMKNKEIINYIKQTCGAIKYIHDRNIIHLDIRPENIICQTELGQDVKLIDFGLARKLNDINGHGKAPLEITAFVAPEVMEPEQAVGSYTDMWSLGVVTYFLLSGYFPFLGKNDAEERKKARTCQWSFEEYAFRNVSHEAKDFVSRLLIKDGRKRMTAREALNHSWLTRNNIDK